MSATDSDHRASRSRSAQIVQKRSETVERIKHLITVVLPELLESDPPNLVTARSILKDISVLNREIRTETDALLSLEIEPGRREQHLELLNSVTDLLESEPVVAVREILNDVEGNFDRRSNSYDYGTTSSRRGEIDGTSRRHSSSHVNDASSARRSNLHDPWVNSSGRTNSHKLDVNNRNSDSRDRDSYPERRVENREYENRMPFYQRSTTCTDQSDVYRSQGEAQGSQFHRETNSECKRETHDSSPAGLSRLPHHSAETQNVNGGGAAEPPLPNATFQRRLLAFNRYSHSAKELLKTKNAVPRLEIQNAITDVKSSFAKLESANPLPPDAERIIDICFRDHESLCKSLYQLLKSAEDSVTAASQASLRFEKQKIPSFSGKFRDYISFKKKFQDLVEPSMSDSLAHLRLRDESLRRNSYEYQLVRGTTSLADAWLSLNQYFARPSLVKDSVLTDLMMLEQVKHHTDAKALRKILAEIVSAGEDLKAVGLECALGDSALSCLMTKVPRKIREKVDKRTFDVHLSVKQQLELLISLCDKHAAVEEQHILRTQAHGFATSNRSRGGDTRPNPDPSSLNLTTFVTEDGYSSDDISDPEISSTLFTGLKPSQAQDRSNRKGRCLYNPDHTHMSAHCFQFITLAAGEMKKILEDKKACFVCFEKRDANHQCRRPRLCPEVGCQSPSSHSKFLHVAFCKIVRPQSSNAQSLSSEPLTIPRDQTDVIEPRVTVANSTCISVSAEDTTRPGVHALQVTPGSVQQRHEVDSRLGYNTLRPCHLMFLKGRDGTLINVQIFYDQGADLSQVRNDTVSQCAIKPVNCLDNLQMNVAGNPQPQSWGKTYFYDLPLYDQDGEKVYTLPCVSVDYIGTTRKGSVETVSKSFSDLGYDLSDLLKPGSGAIDILVGSNCPYLLPRTISSLGSTQLAMTKFGMIIFGSHPSFPQHDLKTNSELSFISTFLHVNADMYVTESALLEAAPSGSGQRIEPAVVCASCHSLRAHSSVAKSERDAFDQMVLIDDQVACYKCGKCPPGGSTLDREENRRIQIYRECLRYDIDKKVFYTKMPWTKSLNDLPDNRVAAEKRLQAVARSLAGDDSLRNAYIAEFDKMIQSGVLALVSEEEDLSWKSEGNPVWYVSHFPVVNPSSTSTPVRPVFDPTVPFKGVLLDKFWERPPNLIPHLPHLLIRFRERPIPLAVDFKKAYWSVRLEPLESHMHRVLWNYLDPNEPILTYKMQNNSWGMVPSGSICSIAMMITAEKHRDQYPDVYDFISRCMYVDDGTFSVESVDQAWTLARNIQWVMLQGGFSIKHFIIGGKEMELSDEHQSETIPSVVRFGEKQERILGVQWNPVDDTISFNCRVTFPKSKRQKKNAQELDVTTLFDQFPDTITRRSFLSVTATLFDPIGLATPVTIVLKHELGRIFQLDGGWDTPIPRGDPLGPTATYERCRDLILTLLEVKSVQFPRCVRPLVLPATAEPIIVGFADSSETAYAACIYFNWEFPDRTRESRLIDAKAKPFPKKDTRLTIPRGELLACELLTLILRSVIASTSYTISNVFLLTDSTIALCQIQMPLSKLKIWPAVRVEHILENSDHDQWYHIPSKHNVADDATRGLSPSSMGPESRWQVGPDFLALPPSEWPIKRAAQISQSRASSDDLEVRYADPRMSYTRSSPTVAISAIKSAPLQREQFLISVLSRLSTDVPPVHSDWLRLRRSFARVVGFLCQFVSLLKARHGLSKPSDFSSMSRDERQLWIQTHENHAIKPCEMFTAKLFLVAQNQTDVSPSYISKISGKLRPVQDVYGLWRALGRMYTDPLKAPFIIFPCTTLGRIIITWYHRKHHAGADATLADLRSEFWIIKGQISANQVISQCARCRFLRKKSAEVEMAPLKEYQTQASDVFSTVCLDICGPYMTKIAERMPTRQNPVMDKKVWVLVLVCAASRAVHLEVLEGYNTASFLEALDSFISVRAAPSRIIADRGTQIMSASQTMESLWDHVNEIVLQNHLAETTVWEFVPVGAHSFIGMAERMVRGFKSTLETMAFSRQPIMTKLRFHRMLTAIANIMNSRPLTVGRNRASNLNEFRLITPNDLLLGRSSSDATSIAPPDLATTHIYSRETYIRLLRQKESILNTFWTKWKSVVFKTLLPVEKWSSSGRMIQTRDIVLIRDNNPVRGKWTWGEVEKVKTSSDGLVRSASVRYTRGDGLQKFTEKAVRDLVVILPVEERDD